MEMNTVLLIGVFILSLVLLKTECNEERSFIEIGMSPGIKAIDLDKQYARLQRHRRSIHGNNTCKIPFTEEKNYETKCKLYPSMVECTQKCMFGHTFKEGTKRIMKCKHSENKWTPTSEFEECQPFIDCNLTLGQGAYVKCTTHFMDKGPLCDVSCPHFENKPAVSLKKYSCDIKGKWSPELPFCVKAGSGLKLLPRPRGL